MTFVSLVGSLFVIIYIIKSYTINGIRVEVISGIIYGIILLQ